MEINKSLFLMFKKNATVAQQLNLTPITDGDAANVSALLEKESPEVDLETTGAAQDENGTSTLDDVIPTVQFTVDVTKMSNATENAPNV